MPLLHVVTSCLRLYIPKLWFVFEILELAQGEILQNDFTFSSGYSSLLTEAVHFKGRLYGLCEIGRLIPVSMSLVTRSVSPKSPESEENV